MPVVSTKSFPFFKVQNVSIAGCLWSVPTAFLTSVEYKMYLQLGACGQYQQLSLLQSEYKMYPQLGACGQYLSSVRVQNVSTARLPDQIVMETM